jgi:hypothetical protein
VLSKGIIKRLPQEFKAINRSILQINPYLNLKNISFILMLSNNANTMFAAIVVN